MTSLLIPFLLLVTPSFASPAQPDHSAADLNDYSWLVGTWTGEGFGGTIEESWSAPVAGTMMGMFRHFTDDGPTFYEFMLLDETGIRLKHFNPDIISWEEKEEFVHFKMIRSTNDLIEMKDLSYERISDTQLEIRLRLEENGNEQLEVFRLVKK